MKAISIGSRCSINLKSAFQNLKSAIMLGSLFLDLSASAEAQQGRIYRVGILGPEKLADRPQIKGLRDGLREAGYVEGKIFS
jgi:hypothetical protein